MSQSPAPPAYSHTQIGYSVLLFTSLVIGGIVAVVTPALASSPQPGWTWVAFFGSAGITYLLLLLFSRLRVEIRDGTLTWHFGFGAPRYSVPISEITEARVVKNSLLYGFGIRATPNGMLYNVSGRSAVQVVTPAKRVQIGTDDPEGLLSQIEAARRAAPSHS